MGCSGPIRGAQSWEASAALGSTALRCTLHLHLSPLSVAPGSQQRCSRHAAQAALPFRAPWGLTCGTWHGLAGSIQAQRWSLTHWVAHGQTWQELADVTHGVSYTHLWLRTCFHTGVLQTFPTLPWTHEIFELRRRISSP